MTFTLPTPPNPDDAQFRSNPLAYSRAIYDWAQRTKGKLEQSHSISNGIPISSPQVGDTPYKALNAWARLPAGSPGQLYTQTGTGTSAAPSWGNISSLIAAGSNVTVSGTSTVTIALSTAATSQIKIGSFTRDLSTASGTSTTTGLGMQPKAVSFISGINSSTIAQSWGADDGTNSYALYNGNSGVAGQFGMLTGDSIVLIANGTSFNVAKIASFIPDGFTIAWTKTGAPTGTAIVGYNAVG